MKSKEKRTADDSDLVVSYLTLRKSIGILGMTMPFVLALGGAVIFKTGLQETVSDYYHTGMEDVFVGVLCAMGVFLFSYKGYERRDNIASSLAAFCVIATALFPTTPLNPTALESTIGTAHIVFASVYFSTLAYISLALFTKGNPAEPFTRRKSQRNRVYRVCGYAIVVALIAIALFSLLPAAITTPLNSFKLVFWLESIAIVAFGIAWFVKGEGILQDRQTEKYRDLEKSLSATGKHSRF